MAFEHGCSVKVKGSGEYRTYVAWLSMRWRCYNKNRKDFANYGGRGIVVCEKWKEDFAAFLKDVGIAPSGTSLDRINNAGNYELGNVRWATAKQQASNRRSNVWLTLAGKTQTITQWSTELGLSSKAVQKRIAAGWSVEEALSTLKSSRWRRNPRYSMARAA